MGEIVVKLFLKIILKNTCAVLLLNLCGDPTWIIKC